MVQSLKNSTVPTKIMNDNAASTGDTLNSSIIDMAGFSAVMGIVALGDVTDTAVLTLKAYVGKTSNLADGAYLTNTATVTAGATDSDDNLLVLDVADVGSYRYVRFDLVRATANAAIDSAIAIKYNARGIPSTNGTDVAGANVAV
jgi:hypothetical protein